MELYKDNYGNDCITITNEDGTTWSGLKSAWDAQQVEHLTEIIPSEAPAE